MGWGGGGGMLDLEHCSQPTRESAGRCSSGRDTVETIGGGRGRGGCWIRNTVPSLPESRLGGVAAAVRPAVEDTVDYGGGWGGGAGSGTLFPAYLRVGWAV